MHAKDVQDIRETAYRFVWRMCRKGQQAAAKNEGLCKIARAHLRSEGSIRVRTHGSVSDVAARNMTDEEIAAFISGRGELSP